MFNVEKTTYLNAPFGTFEALKPQKNVTFHDQWP